MSFLIFYKRNDCSVISENYEKVVIDNFVFDLAGSEYFISW